MGLPVVHFEIIGTNPDGLRSYYGELFGWEFDTSSLVSAAVSEPANYGFVAPETTSNGIGIPGGVGGGAASPMSRPRCRRPRAWAGPGGWGQTGPPPGLSSATSLTPRAT
jgi:hypothetical protein